MTLIIKTGEFMLSNIEKMKYTKSEIFKNTIREDDKLLNKRELAEFLNVSVKTIDKKVHLNEIPFMKIGRLVRFSKSKILAWAEGNNSSR